MKLSTQVRMGDYRHDITYDSRLWFIGSCFAGNIGEKFAEIKMQTVINPFGTLFSPHSVNEALMRVVEKRYFTADDFFERDGVYMSMDLHSTHSYVSIDDALCTLNELIDTLHESLSSATHLFITYGTSQVYRYNPTGRLCANCHKIPSRFFTIEQMSIDSIYEGAMRVERALMAINPDVKIYYTISPVRYMGDGAPQSSYVKARLFCALERVMEETAVGRYIPSYEIMMDELRDYRYYGEDMIHPSSVAVDYIWERIQEAFFDRDTAAVSQVIKSVMKAVSHRPQNPEGEQYRLFCKKNIDVIEDMCSRYPSLDMEKEKAFFVSKL